MVTLHPDLTLLAAVAEAHGLANGADNLYALAHYRGHRLPPMTASDMQCGLSLLGIDSYKLVAPGLTAPQFIQHAIDEGCITLAQVRGLDAGRLDYWVALHEIAPDDWQGTGISGDWGHFTIAGHLGHVLTGFYLICSRPLPGWQTAP